ncbi:hypothetical protein [Pseudomonas sp. A34-9]|uniref:hypothetical protein n=1 Tax=Pseudomonas sp. A34-9 TaxID=3034675 RepID=UPI00240D2173|nr:hypothetical protein [Pseudomonas sp. A34-9]
MTKNQLNKRYRKLTFFENNSCFGIAKNPTRLEAKCCAPQLVVLVKSNSTRVQLNKATHCWGQQKACPAVRHTGAQLFKAWIEQFTTTCCRCIRHGATK